MNSNTLFVFKNNHKKQLVGRLSFNDDRIEFTYARSFLLNSSNNAINPFYLPLESRQRIFSEDKLHGVLTVFADALPGKWGTRVLEKVKGRPLFDNELLLEDQVNRVGDLVFNTTEVFPELSNNAQAKSFDFNELIKAKELIEDHQTLSDKQKMLIKYGSSQGGARPKFCLTKEDGQLCLVKMPSIYDDQTNNQQTEHGTLALAKLCGINTVKTELFEINNRDLLIIKRFDRNEAQEGIPYLSMASVCAVKDMKNASYLSFAEEMQRLGGVCDLQELFKRMMFNVLVSNKDDHHFNHGLLFNGHQWQLSPAFDIVAGEGNSRHQSLIMGNYGKESSIRNALSCYHVFGLSGNEATDITQNMINIVGEQWRNAFLSSGATQATVDSTEWAILHDDIFRDFENMKYDKDTGFGIRYCN